MASQEDYLDQLLKGLVENTEQAQVDGNSSELSDEIKIEESASDISFSEAEELLIGDIVPEAAYEEDVIIDAAYDEDTIPEAAYEEDIIIEADALEDFAAETSVTAEALNEEMLTSEGMYAPEEMFASEDASAESVLDMSDMDELLKFAMEEEESEPEGMSEEEIEQILNANQNSVSDSGSEVENGNGEELSEADDLMSLLEGSSEEDGDLQDIHDMLQKADNNEAVDEEHIAAMQEITDAAEGNDNEQAPAGLLGDSEEGEETELTERQKKALEKKRLREEKAAARKAAKEAKKAEKLAKKEAKKGKTEEDESAESDGGIDMYEALPAEDAVMDAELSETDMHDADLFADLEMLSSGDKSSDSTDSVGESFQGNEAEYIEDTEATEATDDKTVVGEPKGKPKRNLLSMILNFLTEEDEDDEEAGRGTEDIPLSDENRQVLKEMDQEIPDKKDKNKKDKKKGKKPNIETADGEDEETEGEKKDTKGKKAKKPKKEKPPREKAPVNPRDKITFKKLLPIILLGMSLIFVIMLYANLGSDFVGKNHARKAYYEEDYETCYQELYGRKLNETEQVMFGKSESILRIRLWMREYELFVTEGSEMEALDVLIQSVNDYAGLYDYANQWNAGGEVAEVYGQMLVILRDKYGLTEAQALEIAAEPDDVEYTRLVAAVIQGDGYSSQAGTAAQESVNLPDMLPEEEYFPENSGGR